MSKLTNTTVRVVYANGPAVVGARGAYTPHLNTATQLKY